MDHYQVQHFQLKESTMPQHHYAGNRSFSTWTFLQGHTQTTLLAVILWIGYKSTYREPSKQWVLDLSVIYAIYTISL